MALSKQNAILIIYSSLECGPIRVLIFHILDIVPPQYSQGTKSVQDPVSHKGVNRVMFSLRN